MSTLEKAMDLLQAMPENKLETVYMYMRFINSQTENDKGKEINNSLLSEFSLAKDWLSEEEDLAWQDL